MSLLQDLINSRIMFWYNLSKSENKSIPVLIWKKYKDIFDYDKVWKSELEFRNKGSFYNKPDFNDEDWNNLIKIAEKYFLPCVIVDDFNIEEFILDVLIQMIEIKELEKMTEIINRFKGG